MYSPSIEEIKHKNSTVWMSTNNHLKKLNLLYKTYILALSNPKCLNYGIIIGLNSGSSYKTIKTEYDLIKHLPIVNLKLEHFNINEKDLFNGNLNFIGDSQLETMANANEKYDMLCNDIISIEI